MSKRTVRYIILAVFAALSFYGYLLEHQGSPDAQGTGTGNSDTILARAFEERQSDLQVRGSGTVQRILRDDNSGSRHQLFILELDSGQTVLISHNIDLAPRINALRAGDRIEFFGEYEWNKNGGVVHWTHHDPGGRHPDGWLKHGGKTYQ